MTSPVVRAWCGWPILATSRPASGSPNQRCSPSRARRGPGRLCRPGAAGAAVGECRLTCRGRAWPKRRLADRARHLARRLLVLATLAVLVAVSVLLPIGGRGRGAGGAGPAAGHRCDDRLAGQAPVLPRSAPQRPAAAAAFFPGQCAARCCVSCCWYRWRCCARAGAAVLAVLAAGPHRCPGRRLRGRRARRLLLHRAGLRRLPPAAEQVLRRGHPHGIGGSARAPLGSLAVAAAIVARPRRTRPATGRTRIWATSCRRLRRASGSEPSAAET